MSNILTPSERDAIASLPPAQAERALKEIAARPQVLPMDERAYPSGAPDRIMKKIRQTGCIGNMSQHGK
jgi:hypothetical protein